MTTHAGSSTFRSRCCTCSATTARRVRFSLALPSRSSSIWPFRYGAKRRTSCAASVEKGSHRGWAGAATGCGAPRCDQALGDNGGTLNFRVGAARAKRDTAASAAATAAASTDALARSASASPNLSGGDGPEKSASRLWLPGSKSGPLKGFGGSSSNAAPLLIDMEEFEIPSVTVPPTPAVSAAPVPPASATAPPAPAAPPLSPSMTAEAAPVSRSSSSTPALEDETATLPQGAFRAVILSIPYLENFFDSRLPQTFFLTKGARAEGPGRHRHRAVCRV